MCLLCRLVLVTFLFVLLFLVRYILYTSCVLRALYAFNESSSLLIYRKSFS